MEHDKNGGPNFLSDWRDFRKFTQADLAAAVGTNTAMISMLESGQRGLSAKWLRKLAIPLECQPGDIIEFSPYDAPADLIDTLRAATPQQVEQVRQLAETVLRWAPKPQD